MRKKRFFHFIFTAHKSIPEINQKIMEVSGLQCIFLSKLLGVAYDAHPSKVGIDGVSSEDSYLVHYLNEKLNKEKQWNSSYDKEFYSLVQSLLCWQYHLL